MTGKNLKQSKILTEREFLILKMRFGIDMPNEETWTLHQIAKIFKISHDMFDRLSIRLYKNYETILICMNLDISLLKSRVN